MSFTFTWKQTGETITLPTPDDKQTVIDPLPQEFIFIDGEEIEKMIKEWEALPFYKRFFYKLKEFWNRYV